MRRLQAGVARRSSDGRSLGLEVAIHAGNMNLHPLSRSMPCLLSLLLLTPGMSLAAVPAQYRNSTPANGWRSLSLAAPISRVSPLASASVTTV